MAVQIANSGTSAMQLVLTVKQAPPPPSGTNIIAGNNNTTTNLVQTTGYQGFIYPAYTTGPQQVAGLVQLAPCCTETLEAGTPGCETITVYPHPNSGIFLGNGQVTLTYTPPGGPPVTIVINVPPTSAACPLIANAINTNFSPLTAVNSGCAIDVCCPVGDPNFAGSTLSVAFSTGLDIGDLTFNSTTAQFTTVTLGTPSSLQPNTTDCGDCRQGLYKADFVPDDNNFVLPARASLTNNTDYYNSWNSWLLVYPTGYDAVTSGDFKLQSGVLQTNGSYDWTTIAILDNADYGVPFDGTGTYPFSSCGQGTTGAGVYGDCAVNYQGFQLNWRPVLQGFGVGTYRFIVTGLGTQDVEPGYCLFSPPFCLQEFECPSSNDSLVRFEANYCGGHIGDVVNMGNSWQLGCNTTAQSFVPACTSITISSAGFPQQIQGTFTIGSTTIPVNFYGTYNNYLIYLTNKINALVAGYAATYNSTGITICGGNNGVAVSQSFNLTSENFNVQTTQLCPHCSFATQSSSYVNTGFVTVASPAQFTTNSPAPNFIENTCFTGGTTYTAVAGHLKQSFSLIVDAVESALTAASLTSFTVSATINVNGSPVQTITQTIPTPYVSSLQGVGGSTQFNFNELTLIAGQHVTIGPVTATITFHSSGSINAGVQITSMELWNTDNDNPTVVNYAKTSGGQAAEPAGVYSFFWQDAIMFGGSFGIEGTEIERTQIKYQSGAIYKVRDEVVRNYTLRTTQLPMWLHRRFYAYALMADNLVVSDYNLNNDSYLFKDWAVVADSNYNIAHKNYTRYPKCLDCKFKDAEQFVYRDRC